MSQRYTAQRMQSPTIRGTDWYVAETHEDGELGWIKCYCHGEDAAKEIAQALNACVAINELLYGSRQ